MPRKKRRRKPQQARQRTAERGYSYQRYYVGPSKLRERMQLSGFYGSHDFLIFEAHCGPELFFSAAVMPDPTGMNAWRAGKALEAETRTFEQAGGVSTGLVGDARNES